jgi:hypothetical protein
MCPVSTRGGTRCVQLVQEGMGVGGEVLLLEPPVEREEVLVRLARRPKHGAQRLLPLELAPRVKRRASARAPAPRPRACGLAGRSASLEGDRADWRGGDGAQGGRYGRGAVRACLVRPGVKRDEPEVDVLLDVQNLRRRAV